MPHAHPHMGVGHRGVREMFNLCPSCGSFRKDSEPNYGPSGKVIGYWYTCRACGNTWYKPA